MSNPSKFSIVNNLRYTVIDILTLIYSHADGLGDLDFLTEGIGGINMRGMPPMSGGVPVGSGAPFGMDAGLSDLFGLQTGPSVISGGPVVLPKQVCDLIVLIIEC